jgi:hypothetical protein
MVSNFIKALRREAEKQQKVWNLIALQKSFPTKARHSLVPLMQYTVRQVLDLISPNWRDAKNPDELELNI